MAGGLLLTCRHVIEGKVLCEADVGDGVRRRVVEVVHDDDANDIVILRVDPPFDEILAPELDVEAPLPAAQIEVVRVGSPRVGATVIASLTQAGTVVSLRCRGPAEPGWSGSPVTGSRGRLLGVARTAVDETVNARTEFDVAPAALFATVRAAESIPYSIWQARLKQSGRLEAVRLADNARKRRSMQDIEGAAAKFRASVEADPSYRLGWHELAWSLGKLERFDEFICVSQEYLRLDPDNAGFWHGLGVAQMHRHYLNSAAQSLQKSVSLRPDGEAYFWLGVACLRVGRFDDGIVALRESLATPPRASGAHVQLAYGLELAGRQQEALNEYALAVQEDPRSPGAQAGLLAMQVLLGRTSEAKASTDTIVSSLAAPGRVIARAAGLVQLAGQSEEAAELYRIASNLDDSPAEVRAMLAEHLAEMGRWTEALAEAEAVQRAFPESPSGHDVVARAYLALGRFQEAAAEYERLRVLKGPQVKVLYALGVAQFKGGDPEAADRTVEDLAKLDEEAAGLLKEFMKTNKSPSDP